MKPQRLVTALLNVEHGEGRTATHLFAIYFLMGIASVAMRTAAYALFVTEFGSSSLAYTYIAIAIGAPILTGLYLQLSKRLKLKAFLVTFLLLLALITFGLRLGLELDNARWVIFLLPLWDLAVHNIGAIYFWSLVEQFFDIRQTKRLAGLLNAGRWLAFSAGGFAIPLIVGVLDTRNLLNLSVIAILLALILLALLIRLGQAVLAAKTSPAAPSKTSARADGQQINSLLRNRFVLLIFTSVIFAVGTQFFVNNIFYVSAASTYPDTNQLAAFTATVTAVAGVGTLLASLLLVGPVLSRYGISAGLLVQPIIITIIFCGLTFSGMLGQEGVLFGLAALAQIIASIVGNSLFSSTHRVIIQAVPSSQRSTASTLSEGAVEPVAVGLAGLLFLVITETLRVDVIQMAVAFLPVGILWIGMTFWLIRRYPSALQQVLSKRQLTTLSLEQGDHSTAQVLRKSLESSYPEEVIYALGLLSQMKDQSLGLLMPRLLTHPSAQVQLWALDYIQRQEQRDLLPQVRDLLDITADRKVCEAALRTVAALGGEDVQELVNHRLRDSERTVQRGAMVGLLQSGGLDGILYSGHRLQELLISHDAEDRVLAAEVLGEAGIRSFYQPLIPLFQDRDPRVRRAAVAAVGKIQHPKLWRTVVQAILDNKIRAAALGALLQGGQAALADISAAFEAQSSSPQLLVRLARICGRMRSDAALQLLQKHLEFPDSDVRAAIFAALSSGGYRADDADRIETQIRVEAQEATWILDALNDLNDEPEVMLLRGALQQQLGRVRERILLLESFICDSQAMLRAREAVQYGTPEQRAYGVELIDTMLGPEMKPYVLPIIQGAQSFQHLEQLHDLFELRRLGHRQRILDLIYADQRWVRACAIYAAAQYCFAEASESVQTAALSSDPLVMETARYALTRFGTMKHIQSHHENASRMSTIEKVIILKSVSIFSNTPDDVLVEVASLLEEEMLGKGDMLFRKGELGTCMYIVVSGRIRIHDGEHTLDHRESRQVFGELALLDPEPRMASATGAEDTLLFRLDQEPFYELMADQIEVVRGIMRVVTKSLRDRVSDVRELRARLHALEHSSDNA